MQLPSGFVCYDSPNEKVLALLEKTCLGTNGAKYVQLDTRQRIVQVDQPLFLCLERNNRVIGNLTCCKRGSNWYIRYFAFDALFQGSGVKSRSTKKPQGLRVGIHDFFNERLDSGEVNNFYAYIDPKNSRSLAMAEQFELRSVASLITQTFSRVKPKKSDRFIPSTFDEVAPLIRQTYSKHQFYFEDQIKQARVAALKTHDSRVEVSACYYTVNWRIERLPGKFGGALTYMLPIIPIIRKLISPQHHKFLVVDSVCFPKDQPELLQELFSSLLAEAGVNSLIWWVDEHDPQYNAAVEQMNWGLLDRILGRNRVHVVRRGIEADTDLNTPHFVCGFDLI